MKVTPLENWIKTGILKRPESAILSHKDIQDLQLKQMKKTVDYAIRKSPFYSIHLKGISSDDIKTLEDLERFPFTRPSDLIAGGPKFVSVSQSDVKRVLTIFSSGTTSDPKRLYFTEDDIEATIDFFHHGMSSLVIPGQRVLILLPGNRPESVGDLLKKALLRMDVEGVIHGPVRDPAHALRDILRYEIDCLVGIPTQILAMARHPHAVRIPKNRIKSVLLCTDYVSKAIRKVVKKAFRCPVFSHYGMSEMGLGGGVECEANCGCHLREADLYFEIIDPATGNPVTDGTTGEIVFTTLTRKGMPLIRYRTGDFAEFLSESCPCGSVLKRMGPVLPRWNNQIILGNGHLLGIWDLDEMIFPIEGILDYKATVISSASNKDRIEIELYAPFDESKQLKDLILEILQTVPAIKSALSEGCLEIAPIEFCRDIQYSTGVEKRAIKDKRRYK